MTARTSYVAPEMLQAWFDAAGHGHSCIYAAGAAAAGHPTAVLVQGWVARGEVRANVLGGVAGRDAQGRLQYQVTRVRMGTGPTPNPSPEGEGGRLPEELRGLFDLLVEHDAARLPCPSDAQLAALLKLQDRHAAGYRLRRLVKLGLIEVTNPAPLRRVVKIVSKG